MSESFTHHGRTRDSTSQSLALPIAACIAGTSLPGPRSPLRARDDAQIRVVLVRESEDCFASGNDLVDFMQRPPTSADSPVGHLIEVLVAHPKPIVAAVEAVAIGVGTTMLLHCDLVYAAPTTRFQVPFVPLGLGPEAGSSLLLAGLCGHQQAAELLLIGEPFDGARALALGLVNRVVAPAALHAFARERAVALTGLPPASIRLTKRLMPARARALRPGPVPSRVRPSRAARPRDAPGQCPIVSGA